MSVRASNVLETRRKGIKKKLMQSSKTRFFFALLCAILLMGQSCEKAFALRERASLTLERDVINGSVVDKTQNIVRIKNADNINPIVSIQPTKKTLANGKSIKVEGIKENGDLLIDLSKLGPANLIPSGQYILTATTGKLKIKAKIVFNAPTLIVGRLQVPANQSNQTSGRTIREQNVASLDSVSFRTFSYENLSKQVAPEISSPGQLTTNDTGDSVIEYAIITEKPRGSNVVVQATVVDPTTGKSYDLIALSSGEVNKAGFERVDVSPSSTISLNATRAAQTQAEVSGLSFSPTKFNEDLVVNNSIQALDRTSSIPNALSLAAPALAAQSSQVLSAARESINLTEENIDLANGAAIQATVIIPDLVGSRNLASLADKNIIEFAKPNIHAVASLPLDQIPKETALELFNKTGMPPGAYKEISENKLTDAILQNSPPLFEVSNSVKEGLEKIGTSNTPLIIAEGALFNSDEIQLDSTVNVIGKRGSFITGTKDPGYKISAAQDALVSTSASTYTKVLDINANFPVLNLSSDAQSTPGLIIAGAGKGFVSIPPAYDKIDSSFNVVRNDGGFTHPNLYVTPQASSNSLVSSNSNIPIFDAEKDFSSLQAALQENKNSFKGASIAPLVSAFSGTTTEPSFSTTINTLALELPTIPSAFKPLDTSSAISTYNVNNVLSNIVNTAQASSSGSPQNNVDVSKFIDNPNSVLSNKPVFGGPRGPQGGGFTGPSLPPPPGFTGELPSISPPSDSGTPTPSSPSDTRPSSIGPAVAF